RPSVVAAGVVAELAEVAGPPAPDRAVRLQGAGGVVVRRNGLDAGQLPGALDDLHRVDPSEVDVTLRPVAELPVIRGAPAPHGAVGLEGTSVGVTEGQGAAADGRGDRRRRGDRKGQLQAERERCDDRSSAGTASDTVRPGAGHEVASLSGHGNRGAGRRDRRGSPSERARISVGRAGRVSTENPGPAWGAGAPGGTRTHDLQVRNLTLYPLSYGRNLAEREGFEPSKQVTPLNGLANRRTRPLCDLSGRGREATTGPSRNSISGWMRAPSIDFRS